MKIHSRFPLHQFRPGPWLALAVALSVPSATIAQTSLFTYQGQLLAGQAPAEGRHDLRFTLHSTATGGTTVAGPVTNANVTVDNGYFAVTLDFGAAAFDGAARWLEIGVRTNGSAGNFTTLAPRQPVTATPYAVRAATFSGAIVDSQLTANIPRLNANATFSGVVRLTNAANALAGNGSALTDLDASDLAQGTVPDARLSADVARRSTSQAFAGINTFSNAVRISDSDTLEFGAGLAGKELNAGKIGYGTFTANTLDIVGAGTFATNRSIRFHAERDAQFMGPVRLQSDRPVYLRGGTDNNHGLGYFGGANLFAGANLDGPALFGWGGGGLGNRQGTNETLALTWGPSGVLGLNLASSFGPDPNYVGTTGNYISFGHVGVSEDFIGYKNNTFYFMDSPGGADVAPPNVVVGGNLEAAMLILNGGADLSEGFGLTDDAEPGMVVCIDPESPGKVRTSQRAYDRTVAGIISGAGGVNTGLMMSQKGSVAHGEHPVALTGRVYCRADATSAAIEPGDLLTTSALPGHAMKVTDSSRAPGAVLGKAMTGLKNGRGLVLVLVSLQ